MKMDERKIYCKNEKEFREVQKVLLLQGYRWQASGEKEIELFPYLTRVLIRIDKVNGLLWYSDKPKVIGPDMISAENYLKINNTKYYSVKNWIDKEFNIKLD